MGVEEHMEVNDAAKNEDKPKRKLEKTVLDNFSNLTKSQGNVRIKSAANLLRYLVEVDENNDNKGTEIKYALGRVVRGLGSSEDAARAGFFTTLVTLLKLKTEITVCEVLEHLNKHLHKGSGSTKGENADIFTGQILTCGAIIKSQLFNKGSQEEQKIILETLTNAGKERAYLNLLSYRFIVELFNQVNEKQAKKSIFPVIKPELSKPWTEQTLDTLYLLVSAQQKYPNLVNSNFLQSCLGSQEIVSGDTCSSLTNVLMNIPRETTLKHSIYEIITKCIAEKNLANEFFHENLDKHLDRPNRNKLLLALNLLTSVLSKLQNFSVLHKLLTDNFIKQLLAYYNNLKGRPKDAEFQQHTKTFYETLVNTAKLEGVKTKEKVKVLKRILINPGTFIFEKITNSKLVQHIMSTLDSDGVKIMAGMYRSIVSNGDMIYREHMSEKWLNNDRVYAADLLLKLINHPAMQNDIEWKGDQIMFLMHVGLLKLEEYPNIGCELAGSLKEAFYRALDFKLMKLEDIQTILLRLVMDLDVKLNLDNLSTLLRTPMNDEKHYQTWRKTIQLISELQGKKKKPHGLKSVFLTLFLHMGLQLCNNYKLASGSLQDIFSCYERIKRERKSSNNSIDDDPNIMKPTGEDENTPLWIEVVTDLFLNLLSQNTHLLRSLVNMVFKHLCQYVNETAIHHILSVIDPKNEEDPLSRNNESEDEDEENDEEESESEEEEEDDDDSEENETENDKLRMALHQALGGNGYNTDEESLDLDQMSETEGEKLDKVLAEAFRQYKPNKGKGRKQGKDAETLTHFRVRVLDLIEIYINSNPPMILALEIMLPLLQAVEFTIRDEHQKPLHNRLKTVLKKLSAVKEFSGTEGVDETVLTDLLKSLLEKGTKTALIVQDMGEQIADCCIFTIRCSQLLTNETTKKSEKHLMKSLAQIIIDEAESFFTKRDSVTPYVLFKNVLQLTWDGALKLNTVLLSYVYNDEVKPFQRSQAADLLSIFYCKNRILQMKPEKVLKKSNEVHKRFSDDTLTFFRNLCEKPQQNNIKEKFISNLFWLLISIRKCPVKFEINWKEIAKTVREYRSLVSLSNDARKNFNKLCSNLGVPNIVQMKTNKRKLSNNDDDEQDNRESTVNKTKLNNNEDDAQDNSESTVSKEKTPKKKKKPKPLRNDKLKLKKEAKLMRLQSLSEGFSKGVAFITIKEESQDDEKSRENEIVIEDSTNNEEISEEVVEKKSKKRKGKNEDKQMKKKVKNDL